MKVLTIPEIRHRMWLDQNPMLVKQITDHVFAIRFSRHPMQLDTSNAPREYSVELNEDEQSEYDGSEDWTASFVGEALEVYRSIKEYDVRAVPEIYGRYLYVAFNDSTEAVAFKLRWL
jgi:hypothetical protein